MARTVNSMQHTVRKTRSRGYTLVELIVAVGLFAFIMTLASGAYLVMISVHRQVQAVATGINNLSFALETMTRDIRTSVDYSCGGLGDCPGGASSFSSLNKNGLTATTYSLSGSSLQKTVGATQSTLTDPSIVISSLTFYTVGSQRGSPGDGRQPYVTIIAAGTVTAGAGKTESFVIETSATMRGTDI